MLYTPYFCVIIIKIDVVMEKERKFDWCVRYYDPMADEFMYSTYYDLTASEIEKIVASYVASRADFIVRVFKEYKVF